MEKKAVKIIILITSIIIFGIACATEKNVRADMEKRTDKIKQQSLPERKESLSLEVDQEESSKEKKMIKNSPGLITLSDKYSSTYEKKNWKDFFIRIYNEDGTLWHKFTYYYDDSDGKFEYQKDDFLPFSFHPDYFLLALKCVGEDKNRYQVIVNEEKQIKKYVLKNDSNLRLESWEDHILETFSLDLKKKKNPVFDTPDGNQINYKKKDIERIEAVKFKGDWLKVKLEFEDEKTKSKSGWVRWKKDDRILIDWFYFA